MQFSKELLGSFFAPGIDDLKFSQIRDLKSEIPNQNWLWSHFINSIFSSRFNESWRARFITMAFRTKAAINAYDLARTACTSFVENSTSGSPAINSYFEAVAQFEMVIHNINQIGDIFQKANGERHAETTTEHRVGKIANRIKHVAEDFEASRHSGLTILTCSPGM